MISQKHDKQMPNIKTNDCPKTDIWSFLNNGLVENIPNFVINFNPSSNLFLPNICY